MSHRFRFAVAVLLAIPTLVLPVPAIAAHHEPGEASAWDQEAVSALAQQLADGVKGIRNAFRNEPSATIASAEARARYELQDILRRLEGETRYLAKQLAEGRGHDETLPVFETLLMLVRDAQDEGRRIYLQTEVRKRVVAARVHLAQLDPYYEQKGSLPEPLVPPSAE